MINTSILKAPTTFANSAGQLHNTVSEILDSDNFGPDDYQAGLAVLLLSLDYDPRLSEFGRQMAWRELCKTLYARGYLYQQLAAHPDSQNMPIQSPVVITGIPRTGTTALHKLMALDENFQGLQTWLIGNPMPRPPQSTWQQYQSFQATLKQLQERYQHAPDRLASHKMSADEVDECCLIMRQTFTSNIWSCIWSAASYDLWLQNQSELNSYHYLKTALQLIGSNDSSKRWLLKNPGHIAHLDSLFAVFPDAKVIHTHRDPVKAIPSLCSMFIKSHDLVEQGRRDLRAKLLGIRELEKWSAAIHHAETVKAEKPEQVLDVSHQSFVEDPLVEIERIYRFIGQEFSPTAKAEMLQRIQDDPERQHGKHHYQLADFGLTQAMIKQRFGE